MSLPQKSALYIRVSTHWQVDKNSLQIQERDLVAYSQIILGIQNYEIFKDAGFSGKNTDRPKFQEMMLRIRNGEFSHLIVWKVDRISRNLVDFANMYAELKNLGVVFVSKNEQFDTSTAIGEAMLKIILVFAELERNMTSERVKAVMLSRANEAKYNGGPVLEGYKIDPETHDYLVDTDNAQKIKYIFDLYEQEKSLRIIAKKLLADGIKSGKGRNFSTAQLHRILTNQSYIGVYQYNKNDISTKGKKYKPKSEWVTIPGVLPPIISEEQFYRVQEIIKSNSMPSRIMHTKNIHLYPGLLYCGECGNRMVGGTSETHRKDHYMTVRYRCKVARTLPICNASYITEHKFSPILFRFISNILSAQKQFKKGSPKSALLKKLLAGKELSGITLTEKSLNDIYAMMSASLPHSEFKLNTNKSVSYDNLSQLENQRIKTETALQRLKSLYLFSENAMPEKEYLVEKYNLEKQLSSLNETIKQYKIENESALTDDLLFDKIAYYLTISELTNMDNFDYIKYITAIDKKIPQTFFTSIIHRIYFCKGQMVLIIFKNGLIQEFVYDDPSIQINPQIRESIINL